MKTVNILILLPIICSSAIDIPLVTFDGEESTTFKFHELNDPVMGGVSVATWDVDEAGRFGILNGTVKNVPSLKAPGFVAAYAIGHMNDASAALSGDLVLKVRTSTPEYAGYRMTFSPRVSGYSCASGGHLPLSGGCFKARFDVPSGEDFVEVRIPFSDFTDHWSSATGEPTVLCSEDPKVCPKAHDLQHIRWVEVWGEGVAGDLHIEIQSIYASYDQTKPELKEKDSDIPLITFDGESSTTFEFEQTNDPVMGGVSSGEWSVNEAEGYGIEKGTVRDVPSLHAPGFIYAEARGKFNDASEAISGDLILKVRSSTPEYTGFRVSFGRYLQRDFKADFSVAPGDEFSEIRIPFNKFSNHWSGETGDQTITCEEDPKVCPKSEDLAKINKIGVWGEGVKGDIVLEVQSISAGLPKQFANKVQKTIKPNLSNISDEYNICQGSIQKDLLYGMDRRKSADYLPVIVDEGETLAEAVCCDSRMVPFAEPQYTFSAPDIRLFHRINHDDITTFYDPVCGLPLFRAPVGRSFEEWQAETEEHGWPSFRKEEVVAENVITEEGKEYVFSKCGTHLGSYLPDSIGGRWCIDLACISGQEI